VAFIDDERDTKTRRREFDVAANGRTVSGVLWSPPEPVVGRPLVCLGHGASGDRHQQPLPWLATKLVTDHGWFALSIDGPVHGRRMVPPGGREAFWPEWKRPGTVEDMTADWKAALDFAQQQPDVGAGPVGYWGLSMGTIYGAPLVGAEPRIEAAVLGLMGMTGPDHYQPTLEAAADAISWKTSCSPGTSVWPCSTGWPRPTNGFTPTPGCIPRCRSRSYTTRSRSW
jgi:hypothetical protein